jgi:Flp pilus assembly protein TadG
MRDAKSPRSFRDCSGATAVEFAIIANVFICFIFGIAYVGIMLFNYASLDWAVDAAVRLATINANTDQILIADAINARLAKFGMSNADVTYTVSTINAVQTAHIAASYAESYTIPFVRTFNMTFRSDAYVPLGI